MAGPECDDVLAELDRLLGTDGASPAEAQNRALPSFDSLAFDDAGEEIREEEALAEDVARTEYLRESLERSRALAARAGTVLQSFEERLAALEAVMIPIHNRTQRLTTAHNNIDKTLETIQSVLSKFAIDPEVERRIREGPRGDFASYFGAIERIRDAIGFMKLNRRFRSAEKALGTLHGLVSKAMSECLEQFSRILRKQSQVGPGAPAAVSASTEQPRAGADDDLDQAQRLVSIMRDLGNTDYEREFIRQRREVLRNRLVAHNPLRWPGGNAGSSSAGRTGATSRRTSAAPAPAAAARSAGAAGAVEASGSTGGLISKAPGHSRGGTSGSGSHGGDSVSKLHADDFRGFLELTFQLLTHEGEFMESIFPEATAEALWPATIEEALEVVDEIGHAVAKTRSVDNIFTLFDVHAALKDMQPRIGPLIEGRHERFGSLFRDLTDAVARAAQKTFAGFLDELRQVWSKKQMPPDGTVHEVTSKTMNILRRIIARRDAAEELLQEFATGGDSAGRSALERIVANVLDILEQNLSSRSHSYRHASLAAMFLLNNYHHMVKTISGSDLATLVGDTAIQRLESSVNAQRELYFKAAWAKMVSVLEADADKKKEIKALFAGFNAALTEGVAAHKQYAVPDHELRQSLRAEISNIIVPAYAKILEQHDPSQFTKNADKYVKYSVDDVRSMLATLFEDRR